MGAATILQRGLRVHSGPSFQSGIELALVVIHAVRQIATPESLAAVLFFSMPIEIRQSNIAAAVTLLGVVRRQSVTLDAPGSQVPPEQQWLYLAEAFLNG
jgi:hypothetical protein